MRTALLKLALVGTATSAMFVAMAGGIASAHVDPDPLAMQAGTSGTVAFNVEHGCNGSPMTDLKIQIPAGVTGVKAVDKAGWTATVVGDTVEFKGGSLPAAQPDHFDITLTVPAQAGDLHFPAIEKCQTGELDWIEIAAPGAPEGQYPADVEGHPRPTDVGRPDPRSGRDRGARSFRHCRTSVGNGCAHLLQELQQHRRDRRRGGDRGSRADRWRRRARSPAKHDGLNRPPGSFGPYRRRRLAPWAASTTRSDDHG
jgi:hypothetical protein